MAHVFGTKSAALLATCHPELVKVMTRALALSKQDFSVICGYRGKEDQEKAFAAGNTKVHYPNSAHNQTGNDGKPRSCAVDVIPYPFTNWNDPAMLTGWKTIADSVFAASKELGIPMRWGGDFNRDGDKTKSDAWDKPHFELHPWRDWDKK